MTIVQEFIDKNEQLLDKVAEENPNLGGALAEALAVIDFFAKSNNVTFDENQKEAILASEPIAVESSEQGTPTGEILKNIDALVGGSAPTSAISEQTPSEEDEILYVVDTTDEDLANLLEEYNNRRNNPSANVFANGRYYVFTEKPQVIEKSASSTAIFLTVKPLIDTQARLTRAELNAILEEKPTSENDILYVVDTTDEDLANRLERYNNDNNNPSANVFTNGRYYVMTEKPQVVGKSAKPAFIFNVKPLINTQARLTRAELNAILEEKPTSEAEVVTHTPIVHEAKEFVDDDIIVSQEDLDALKQIEDLEDLGDINLDELDLGDLDDLDDLEDLDIDDNDDLEDLGI